MPKAKTMQCEICEQRGTCGGCDWCNEMHRCKAVADSLKRRMPAINDRLARVRQFVCLNDELGEHFGKRWGVIAQTGTEVFVVNEDRTDYGWMHRSRVVEEDKS